MTNEAFEVLFVDGLTEEMLARGLDACQYGSKAQLLDKALCL